MKHILLILNLLTVLYFKVFSQPPADSKRDYIWLTGYVSTFDTINHPNDKSGYILDFKPKPLRLNKKYNKLGVFRSLSLLSDSDGRLLFYTNGCLFANDTTTLFLGETINEGSLFFNASCPYGYGVQQGLIILPKSINPYEYYILHLSVNLINAKIGFQADSLRLSKISFDTIEHKIKLLFSDQVLIHGDSLFAGQLAACRHGNGNDWWVIQPQSGRNGYYRLLINSDTVKIVGLQKTGLSNNWRENGAGQACFSPDGSKYVRYNGLTDIQIFDFDRCKGELRNPVHIPVFDFLDTVYQRNGLEGSGVCFSPNSRYLYVSSITKIYQFDLQAANISASKQTVAIYDGSFVEPGYYFTFNCMQLGPDGKIYMNALGAIETIHVIEHPDSAGQACKVVQHKYVLDYPISWGWPYFPNFRLGPLPGNPCGIVSASEPALPEASLRVFPNPAQDYVIADVTLPQYDQSDITIILLNAMGQPVRVQSLPMYASLQRIELNKLPTGVYMVQVKQKGKILVAKKIIKWH